MSEPFADQLALVECMASGSWAADLTDFDRAALHAVLEDRKRLYEALARGARSRILLQTLREFHYDAWAEEVEAAINLSAPSENAAVRQ